MTYGRYHPGDGGGNGDFPRHSTPEPLPFRLGAYKGEIPVVFSAFKEEAAAIWRDDFDSRERQIALALCTLISQTPASLPRYDTDQLPQIARREYTQRYRNGLSDEAKANAQAALNVLDAEARHHQMQLEQRQARNTKRRRMGVRATAVLAMFAGISAATIFGNQIAKDSIERQANLTSMAKEAQNLRSLGICAQDMRMELAFDRRNYAGGEELQTDAVALQTALDANLPCTAQPATEWILHYGAAQSGRQESVVVRREEITSFVNDNWPVQKAELKDKIKHLGEAEYPDEYKLRIAVGDKLYVPQS